MAKYNWHAGIGCSREMYVGTVDEMVKFARDWNRLSEMNFTTLAESYCFFVEKAEMLDADNGEGWIWDAATDAAEILCW